MSSSGLSKGGVSTDSRSSREVFPDSGSLMRFCVLTDIQTPCRLELLERFVQCCIWLRVSVPNEIRMSSCVLREVCPGVVAWLRVSVLTDVQNRLVLLE